MVSRFQFTIGQLARLTIYAALVFSTMRAADATSILMLFPAIHSVVLARAKTEGIGGSKRYRSAMIVVFVIVYSAYAYLYPGPAAILNGAAALVAYSLIDIASALIAAVAKLRDAVVTRLGYQMPLTDASCGPIAWGGFDDEPEPPASASRRAPGARRGAMSGIRS
jgi:hypothetical protein